MRFLFFLPILFLAAVPVRAQSLLRPETGDFLFARLACGPLCEAIEAVTRLPDGRSFSHTGMVVRRGDSVLVLESIGKGVQLRSLEAFRRASPHPILWTRLTDSLRACLPGALAFGLGQVGTPYDDAFLPGNGRYYCSELLADCFRLGCGKNVFPAAPMTFKVPGTSGFFPAWTEYFRALDQPVPEGVPGCNPSGMLGSGHFRELGFLP
jgi:hypothetical protein